MKLFYEQSVNTDSRKWLAKGLPFLKSSYLLVILLFMSFINLYSQTCPFGTATASTGYGVTASGGASGSANAVGSILAAGTSLSAANSATLSTTIPLVIDLQRWIAQGSTFTVAWQRISGTPTASVEVSIDNITFTSLGTLTGTSTTPATSAYVNFTVAAGGFRYVRITRTAGGAFVDGVRYTHTCFYPVNAFEDTRVFLNLGTAKGSLSYNDINYDGDSAIYSLGYVQVTNGTLTLSSSGAFTYKPNASFEGVDYFSYRVCDAGPDRKYYTTSDNTCDTAIVALRALFNCDTTQFFVPIPENESIDFLRDINTGNGDSTIFYAGIAVSSDAIVIYDQWEDGYETNINAPTQSTTQIWGDGDLTNGVAPGFPTDLLDAGKAIVLNNILFSGHSTSTTYDPNASGNDATLQAVIDFDGKDKIFIGGIGAFSKFAWGKPNGTVSMSGATVPSEKKIGTDYILPVGQNTTGGGAQFEVTSLSILATQNSTTVNIDRDANGSIDITVSLNQGETYYLDSRQGATVIAVNQGATISANKPIMVHLLTADFGSSYQGRTYALIPTNQFSTCYYMPAVPQETMRVFFYNPTSSAITITRTTAGGATTTISVNANSSNYEDVNSSGLGYRYCSSVGFTMITTVDYNSPTSDWGFTPVPTSNLTSKVLMSIGAGCDPLNALYGTENDEMALITVDSTTYLYADVNGDGVPDKVSFNNDVDATDAAVTIGGVTYDETTSNNGILLNSYQTISIGSTTGNLNGATFWTKTAANNLGNTGKNIVLVWGQNGGPGGAPNIDAGYTVPNIQTDIKDRVIKSSDSICAGNNTDSIKVIYKGGIGPYKVFWFNESTNTFSKFTTNKDSFTILNLEPGSYLIKVKDANCRSLSVRTVLVARTSGCILDVSGTIYNDANGLVNGAIDGIAKGAYIGTQVYTYLVNNLGVVIDSARVKPNGTYTLTGVRNSSYTVRLSTTSVAIGATAPSASLPTNYANTGEQYGTSNAAGSGIEAGTPNGNLTVTFTTVNIPNVNFGIERTPFAHNKTFQVNPDSVIYRSSGNSRFTQLITLNGASGTSDTTVSSVSTTIMPGKISGSDYEDGRFRGNSGINGKLALTALPDTATNGVLVYNGRLLFPNPAVGSPAYIYWNSTTSRYEIPNFKPDSLVLYVKKANQSTTSFNYAYIDAANKLGSIATYLINYLSPLPIDILLKGKMVGSQAQINWICLNTDNIASYELSRRFIKESNKVPVCAVNETGLPQYNYNDDLSEMEPGVYYYALNSINRNGVKRTEGLIALNHKSVSPSVKNIVLSPNPSNSKTFLNLIGYDDDVEGNLEIFTTTGQKIQTIPFAGSSVSIQTDNLSAGLYSVNIIINGQVSTLLLSVYH
ncbi:MAG: Ig-like domain-containing protein [bacterium]|nr:Ig-like domain-containing protein [bacterium]